MRDYPQHKVNDLRYPLLQHEAEIKRLYLEEKLNCGELANKYNVCRSSIARSLKRNDVKIRSLSHSRQVYEINESVFESIDSNEKAYWLGMLYADGSNTPHKHEVKITLQEQDKETIEEFKKFMGYSGPIKYRIYKDKHPTWSNQWGCIITNKKISADFLKLGMLQHKTYDLKFPEFLEKNTILIS